MPVCEPCVGWNPGTRLKPSRTGSCRRRVTPGLNWLLSA